MIARSASIIFAIGLAIPLACGAARAFVVPDEGDKTTPAPARKKLDLRDYLSKIGKKLDCYFTIERLAGTRDRRSPLDHGEITPGDVATIDALIVRLNVEMAGVAASRDKLNEKVIHLTEDVLMKTKGYDLDRKVSFKCRGTPFQMLSGLNQFYPNFGPRKMEAIPQNPRDSQDFSSEIQVDVQDVPLRQVLTSAVPPPRYHRILWDAMTSTSDQEKGIYTSIVYNGRWEPGIPPPAPPDKGYFIGPNNGVLKIYYPLYLEEVGDRLNCFFTIEENHNRPLPWSERLIDPTDGGTIDAVVAKLNKEAGRFKAVRDEANPSVIHLTNVSLTEAGLNVLDRKVTLAYEGTIEGLLDRLNQINPAIGKWRNPAPEFEAGSVRVLMDQILATRVKVDARDLPIRQLLTSAVSLPGNNRVIWSSGTTLKEGNLYTAISFSGPKSPER